MQNKNAIGNLKNRYIAVLKKCNLLNVFGSLAVVSALSIGLAGNVNNAFAEEVNPENTSIPIMNANTYGDPILINNGTITGDNISGSIYGMYGEHSSGTINYTFTNNNLITVSNISTVTSGNFANANAYGMSAYGTGNHTLTSIGEITVTARGGTADSSSLNAFASAFAFGIFCVGQFEDPGNHTLNNSGDISVTATGGTADNSSSSKSAYADVSAYGMAVQSSPLKDTGNPTLNNSGDISVTATGGTADSSSSSAYVSAIAYGMYTYSNPSKDTGNHTFNNSGDISVTATGGTGTSSGNVEANAYAYGMHVLGTPTAGTFHLLTNTGIINTSASVQQAGATAYAYEAYGENSFTVDTWATTLRDWSANDAVFGLANGQTVTFANSTEGATLILRPSIDIKGNIILDKEYSVANMVAIDDGTGTETMMQQTEFVTGSIEGSIAKVETDVEFLYAYLNNSDPTKPTVSLSRNKLVADMPTQTITAQSLNTNLEHIKGINDVTKNAIADIYNKALFVEEIASADSTGLSAGSTKINPWTVFATTYGSYTDNNEYSFDSGSFGVTGGITYNFNEQFALGGHLNFNITNSDSNNFDSDSNSFAFGAHSQYFINPNWYVKGSASFAFGDSDVEYTQPIGVAKDEFSSFSAFASLSTGYVYEINQNNIIVPEIGLSYLHAENDSYSLDFGAGNEIYKFDMHDNSYDNLYADLSLTWQGNYNLSSSTFSPSVGIGVRQNLTGSDIDSSYDLFNTRFDTTVSSDDTTFLANAGLKWTKDNFTVSADYEGEFGNEQTSHTGSLNFTFKF